MIKFSDLKAGEIFELSYLDNQEVDNHAKWIYIKTQNDNYQLIEIWIDQTWTSINDPNMFYTYHENAFDDVIIISHGMKQE